MKSKSITKSWHLFFLLLACYSCGSELESPGKCRITCSNAQPAVSDTMILRTLVTETITVSCSGRKNDNDEYVGGVSLKFSVEKPTISLPASQVPGIKGDSETAPEKLNDELRGTPVSGISFDAAVLTGKTTADVPDTDDQDPGHRGIGTPLKEWCTDSCGVGSVDVYPMCPGDNETLNTVQVRLSSGSLRKDFTVLVKP